MTKKALLKMLDKTTFTDRSCIEYVNRIHDMLLSFPDDVKLDGLTSIENAVSKGGFIDSRADSTPRDIAKELEMILTEIHSWVVNYTKNRADIVGVRDKASRHCSKVRNVLFWVTISVVGSTLLATVIFALLQWTGCCFNDAAWDWIALAGILDAFVGGIGFIIERILDHRNTNISNEADKAIEENDSRVSKEYINKYKVKNVAKRNKGPIFQAGGDIYTQSNKRED